MRWWGRRFAADWPSFAPSALTEAFVPLPTGTRPCKSGTLNVVDPSPWPYGLEVPPKAPYKSAYVERETADPLQRIEHRAPANGDPPHFHPTKNGKKVPGPHYLYPRRFGG